MYFANKTYGDKELKKYYDKYYGSVLFPLCEEINDDKIILGIRYIYPRIRFIIEKIKNRILGGEIFENNILNKHTELLLPSLLNKRSKYHKYFMPVYESVYNLSNSA